MIHCQNDPALATRGLEPAPENHAGDGAGWITAEAYNDLDEEDQAEYTEWFSVGETPVDGWLANADSQIEDVEKQIQELIESIESEIEELETEEEEEEA